jgi:hypothetical protein
MTTKGKSQTKPIRKKTATKQPQTGSDPAGQAEMPQVDPGQPINLVLSLQDTSIILQVLTQVNMPYEISAPLINKIQGQFDSRIEQLNK